VSDAPGGSLAELLRRLRLAAGLTQEELAEAAGISARSVSDLERGIARTARKETARLLSEALGLSGSARDLFEAVARGRTGTERPGPGPDSGSDPESGQGAGQLPAPPTPLIGRSADVTACCDLLLRADVRLVTITGLGGVGKTRTAIAVAGQLAGRFPDAVFFVGLAPVRDPQLVIASVARAVGVREGGTETLQAQVAARLAGAQALLVVDNFEQVVEAATVVSGLLGACPQVKFLVTSRRPLRVNGEHEYPLAPLALPPPAAGGAGPDELLGFPSVQLIADRIRAVVPGWTMRTGDATAVAEICRRLDGLPLALELAAARAKVLPPAELLARLGERADLLSQGARDADDRHRTLGATLDWSYRLLDARAARLLPQLSAFAGGWTLDAMTGVCDAGDEIEALDALATLIDNSLVWRAERSAGIRFLLPVTIRDYAAQLLSAAGAAGATRDRHLDWYLRLAESAAPELTGASQVTWVRLLGDEQANLRAALDHAVTSGDPAGAHRLAVALWRYWEITGQLAEGRHWLARVLALAGPVPPVLRARAIRADGNLARDQGDLDAAMILHRRALAAFEQAGSDADVASALINIGNVHSERDEGDSAIGCYQASLEHLARAGDPWQEALVRNNLALALGLAGQHARAEEIARQSLAAFGRLGDSRGAARATETLAQIHDEAGQFDASLPLHRQAAATFSEVGDRSGVARALDGMARASAALGDAAGAAWLLGHADSLHEQVGEQFNPYETRAREQTMAALRAALAPEELAAARAAGHDAPADEVARRINARSAAR
jgi:predicted ATPase/DNA-binding XRE family transcriptional regulator